MRMLTNTIAAFLQKLGINPGDRICLFMDKVPELYFGFRGIPKMGAIEQPLFSAFGSESLLTRSKMREHQQSSFKKNIC